MYVSLSFTILFSQPSVWIIHTVKGNASSGSIYTWISGKRKTWKRSGCKSSPSPEGTSTADNRETVRSLKTWKKAEAQLIVLAQKDQVEHLTDLFPEIADIWTLPVSEAELRFHFLRWQQDCKVRKDYWQTSIYLECAKNCSPNLIWFKYKNGIH